MRPTSFVYTDVYDQVGGPRQALVQHHAQKFKPLTTSTVPMHKQTTGEHHVDEWGDHTSKRQDPHNNTESGAL